MSVTQAAYQANFSLISLAPPYDGVKAANV